MLFTATKKLILPNKGFFRKVEGNTTSDDKNHFKVCLRCKEKSIRRYKLCGNNWYVCGLRQ